MVSSPVSTTRSQSSTPHPPNGPPSAAATSSTVRASDAANIDAGRQRAYGTRSASKTETKTSLRVQTEGLASEASEEEDEAEEDDKGDDDEPDKGNTSRRTSSRLAAKTSAGARTIADKSAPTVASKPAKKGKRNAATPSAGRRSPSSPGGTPAPIRDPGNLAKLADVALTNAKGRRNVSSRSAPTGPNARDLLSSLDATGSADVIEVLTSDPSDKLVGFKQLEDWIDGGLDMYRHEFRPLLFPIFCHFYLDLVQQGFKDSAIYFFETHAPSIQDRHAAELHELSTLLLPQHVTASPLAHRFRSEKYVIRMSRAGFALLVGWLTEGIGGEAMGSGEGLYGTREGTGRQARMTVLTVVNGRLKFDVLSSSTSLASSSSWEENTGLISSLIPPITNPTAILSRAANAKLPSSATSRADPNAFNAQQGELKLGPAPLSDSLKEETERVLKAEQGENSNSTSQTDEKGDVKPGESYTKDATTALTDSPLNGLVAPLFSDLLPHPPSFRSVDVQREVEKVRDARKRIKLDPSVLHGGRSPETNGFVHAIPSSSKVPTSALPSICAYTFHDALDGVNCSTFSEDSTLMAAGFSESYIRLWSLKKEKLKGLRSDFNVNHIMDPASLRKIREKQGSSTRKLIGHSGPVFSVAFDTIGGSAAPPKYLLSASADHTTRLWSLDTMTNVVAYRGHSNPVWDVQWSPLGSYFATASRDRTARLWSTERVNALRVFAGHLSDVDCVRFHPNSLYLATGSSDTTCRLWDVQRGACMRVFIGHQGPITAIATSPDGRYLASASTDLNINLWDLGSGRRIKTMIGHTAPINTLSFSACTTMLMSGSADWTVRCWDVKSAGGLKVKSDRLNGRVEEGVLPEGALDEKEEGKENTVDLLETFPTKRTPIINVQVTPRNLCLVSGPFIPPDSR